MSNWFNRIVNRKNSQQTGEEVIETHSVTLNNVHIRYGEHPILNGITLRLDENRIGIIGDNGSGKSTLLKLLNGLLLPTEGEVELFGYATADHQEKLPALAGFIFQNPEHQIIFPTVLEEIAFGLEQLGSSTSEAQQQAREFLKLYRIEDLADRPVQNLSEGQKQLICILGVLIMNPRLLLLDEPFSSLDVPTRHRLLSLIEQRPERVIMVTHDPQTLYHFDRVIWLREGKVYRDGIPEDVIQEYLSHAERQGSNSDWEGTL